MATPALLPRLTSLRALAALAVFFFHTGRDLHWGPGQAAQIFAQGYVGVAFFFTLSGFVLTWSARSTRPGDIYWRRAARIYPLYAVTFLLAALYVAIDGTLNPTAFVLGLLLLQAWTANITHAFSVNGPAWSLSCEAFFYLAFPFALVYARSHERAARHITAVWLVAAVAAGALLTRAGHGLDVVGLVNPLINAAQFGLGMLIAIAFQRGWRPRTSLLQASLLLLIALIALRISGLGSPTPNTLLAPVFALVIAAAATSDIRGIGGVLTSRPLVYAGELSYAFYLVHAVIISALHGSSAMTVLTAFVLSVGVAVLLHHLIERPARRRLLSGRRQPVIA